MAGDAPYRAYYITALDRIGLAILVGGVLAGLVAMLLVAGGDTRSPAAFGLAWLLGALFAMIAIVAFLGPVWLTLHFRGRRGPGAAAAAAGSVALILSLIGQMSGSDAGGGYRLASALGTGLLVALVAAAIGTAMQRVAYRRLM